MKKPKKGEDKKDSSKRWIACPVEDEYFGSDRKASRMERKRLSEKDRSKYKKTDREKFEKGIKQELQSRFAGKELHRGRVLSITLQGIVVDHEGRTYTCTLRGLLKKGKTRLRNLVAVGDFILFEKMPDDEGYIVDIEPRKSTLSRADSLSQRKEQLIAANIDKVLITASVVTPPLKPFLIDRYIIAAKKGNMQPVVIINKIDLLEDKSINAEIREQQRELLEECKRAYKKAKIPIIPISVATGEGFGSLRMAMKGSSSVLSGQSGAGKSSIINALTGLDLPVGEMVKKTRKGAHTTTRANLLPLDFGGWCIDTPGIKSFGVWDLRKDEIELYYAEIHTRGLQCKFADCSHIHEHDCAVLRDLEKGKISRLRYESYQSLVETVTERHRRR